MLDRWLTGWWKRRARERQPAAAVYLSTHKVVAAVASREKDRYAVHLRVDPVAQIAEAAAVLREQSSAVGLGRGACSLVLSPELYSISLVERPAVPDGELREAVRWRIQETVDFPVDQAVLDVFPLPQSASRERSMVFVVAMSKEHLKRLLDRVYSAGISVESVDVTELALRNVTHALHPEADRSVGLLRLTPSGGVFNICRGDELFLSRRVAGLPGIYTEAAWQELNERMVLQVQRSIDYYESAMGQPPCNGLLVASTNGWQERLCGHLGEMLPLPVRSINDDLQALFDLHLHDANGVTENGARQTVEQQSAVAAALPALGGLLRRSGEQHNPSLDAVA